MGRMMMMAAAGRDHDSLFVTDDDDDDDCPFAPGPCGCKASLSPKVAQQNRTLEHPEEPNSYDDQTHFDDQIEALFEIASQPEEFQEENTKGEAVMPDVPSLKDLALKACVRNSAYLHSVGELPYRIARPILLSIENPEQLHRLELASPQLIGDDAEIWRKLIARHVPAAKDKLIEPQDPAKWYKVYRKLKKGEDRNLEEAKQALAASLKKVNASRDALRQNTAIASLPPQGTKRGSSMVLGGRPDQPKIMRYNSRTKAGDRAIALRPMNRPGNIVRDVGMPTVSRAAATSTTGKGMLDRARQEAKIVKTYRQATPSHLLNYFKNPKSQITSVPKSMISTPTPGPRPPPQESPTGRPSAISAQSRSPLPNTAPRRPPSTGSNPLIRRSGR